MISTANIQFASQSQRLTRKLQHKFIGPYEIIEKISAVTCKVKLPDSLRIRPVFHISLLKRFDEGPQEYASRINPPPPPVETEEDIEYEVEYILDKRTRKFGRHERTEYLIKWTGYDETESTWEPLPNLGNAQRAIEEYENSTK
ncbi:uncharacterized protein VTP21DRAFT_8204 [Calcarisporiella thermophila]|uniref:uncharacterized protein n=1 Tax=Calcarisporiella thermophila TaxID=911321 RepID=UPI0037433A69